MSTKSDHGNANLAPIERLKKSFTYLRTIQNIFMTCWLSAERSLPLGYLYLLIHKYRTKANRIAQDGTPCFGESHLGLNCSLT